MLESQETPVKRVQRQPAASMLVLAMTAWQMTSTLHTVCAQCPNYLSSSAAPDALRAALMESRGSTVDDDGSGAAGLKSSSPSATVAFALGIGFVMISALVKSMWIPGKSSFLGTRKVMYTLECKWRSGRRLNVFFVVDVLAGLIHTYDRSVCSMVCFQV